ncbi:MAG: hypothetical protein MUO67_22235 [Anaerolineales bacterium]|nr:hypothetical protein [Anaerolineales bacterium]
MAYKKMDDDLKWLIREWEYLTEDQKKKIMRLARLDLFIQGVIRMIPILFLITLVQFIIWLVLR